MECPGRRLVLKLTLHYANRVAADTHLGELACLHFKLLEDIARAAHLVALLDDAGMHAIWRGVEFYHNAGKSGCRRACCRVFGDSHGGCKHAGMKSSSFMDRLPAIDECIGVVVVAECLAPMLDLRHGAANCIKIAHWNKCERHTR